MTKRNLERFRIATVPDTTRQASVEDSPAQTVDDRPLAGAYFSTSTGRPATDLVMAHILDGLVAGELVPGQRVNASKLSKQLDVSVVPVREAIHFLAGEGVIELLPLKGARIREMNADEIVDWWHIYRAISSIGFQSAAEAIVEHPDQISRIKRALDRIDDAEKTQPPVSYILSLADFHRVCHSIGDKQVLDDAIRRLQVVFWCSFLPQYIPFDIYGPYFSQHYRIVGEAILRGDGETAISAFRHHVEWSSAIIMGERPEPGAPWQMKRVSSTAD